MNTFRICILHIGSGLSVIAEVEAETAHQAEVKVEQLLVYGGDASEFQIESLRSETTVNGHPPP